MDINKTEKVLFSYWSGFIKNKESVTTNATCYESEVRFPTDQKLLWECVDWNHGQLKKICKELKLKLPRSKYLKWKRRYISYSKMRRKTNKKRTPLTRALLHLLNKLNKELDALEKKYDFEIPDVYYKRKAIIKKKYTVNKTYFLLEVKSQKTELLASIKIIYAPS